MAYASGFLVRGIFFDRFGIQSTGEDFFRAQYIHIGILFLLFPVCIALPIILYASRWHDFNKRRKQEPSTLRGHKTFRWSSMLTIINLSSIIYIYILFLPTDAVRAREIYFLLLILLTYSLPRLTNEIDEFRWKLEEGKPSGWLILLSKHCPNLLTRFIRIFQPGGLKITSHVIRWGLCLPAIAALDVALFWGYWKKFYKLIPTNGPDSFGVIYYVIFIMLIAYTQWRSNEYLKKLGNRITVRERNERRIIAASISTLFYFCAIIAFAVRVYPLIPVSKGGGNYEECRAVSLHLKPLNYFNFDLTPDALMKEEWERKDLFILIEQTPTSIFLARKTDAGGPHNWRHMLELPRIVEISRDAVEVTEHGITPANMRHQNGVEK